MEISTSIMRRPKLMSVTEASNELKVSSQRCKKFIKDGVIVEGERVKLYAVLIGRTFVIFEDDFIKFKEQYFKINKKGGRPKKDSK